MSHKLLRRKSKKINRKRSTNKRNPNNRKLTKSINQPYNPALSKSNPNSRLSKQRRLKSSKSQRLLNNQRKLLNKLLNKLLLNNPMRPSLPRSN